MTNSQVYKDKRLGVQVLVKEVRGLEQSWAVG